MSDCCRTCLCDETCFNCHFACVWAPANRDQLRQAQFQRLFHRRACRQPCNGNDCQSTFSGSIV
jgi:hypothetical protein